MTTVRSTRMERVEIIRLGPGSDLLEGLSQAMEDLKIRNGVILAGIGSVTDYHFHVVSDKNLPPAEEISKASVPKDLTSVQGYILNGRMHAHITLSDESSMMGGHLVGRLYLALSNEKYLTCRRLPPGMCSISSPGMKPLTSSSVEFTWTGSLNTSACRRRNTTKH